MDTLTINNNETLECLFESVDTWFFKESMEHGAVGASQLGSEFPPPVNTLFGAVRTAIGDLLQVDWSRYNPDNFPNAYQWIGNSEKPGNITVRGYGLALVDDNGTAQPLYPLPAYFMQTPDKSLTRLTIGAEVECDLGVVPLPQLKSDTPPGSKPAANLWATAAGFKQLLQGHSPSAQHTVCVADLVSEEARLGIARDNKRAAVEEGMLYQTRHLRIENRLRARLNVSDLPDEFMQTTPAILRLGGEGRTAQLTLQKGSSPGSAPNANKNTVGIIISLLTHGLFNTGNESSSWLLPSFEAVLDDHGRPRYWQGTLAGIPLNLRAVVMPRMVREGGWDQQNHRPKALRNFVAPGSSFYCELQNPADLQQAIDALHGLQIGQDTDWGRGLIACGLWQKDEHCTGL